MEKVQTTDWSYVSGLTHGESLCTVLFFGGVFVCLFVCSVIGVHVVFEHTKNKRALKNMQEKNTGQEGRRTSTRDCINIQEWNVDWIEKLMWNAFICSQFPNKNVNYKEEEYGTFALCMDDTKILRDEG